MSPKVLFIFSSAEKNLKGGPTGWFLPEAAHPYFVLKDKTDIDFAAPKGPNPPVDPYSVETTKEDALSVQFLNDETVKSKLANAKTLSEINIADYDAIFYPGGHGPMIDLACDELNGKLASQHYRAGKVTAAVCHGPGALVLATSADGKSIFAGRNVTGFTDAEEVAMNMVAAVPFLLEDRMKELGGEFSKADLWGVKVVVDGNLITGQNPASAAGVGEAILKVLKL
ncbi:hypothetical protein EIP91_007682 [Steccherinum ochraceum]|uniref:D-lactate dehydratase n=1 Tax=Steccherinum ochraceum TaxID=92696 RepID=A0A4R0R405_9APHY|nr:hypothetical protein EIP91_007682 [Steccherinum ochraceum]